MSKQKSDQMVVVGAGMGRTATQSLYEALNMLDLKCYHMEEVYKDGHFEIDVPKWNEVYDQLLAQNNNKEYKNTKLNDNEPNFDYYNIKYDWDNIFKDRNYRAAVDWPSSMFWQSQMEYYPNSKVILTVRSSPDAWHNSTSTTIYMISQYKNNTLYYKLKFGLFNRLAQRFSRNFNETVWKGLFEDNMIKDPAKTKKVYEDWIEHVKKNVPKERLLILDLKKNAGKWDTLCEFLGVDIPRDSKTGEIVAFPFSNNKQHKQQVIERRMRSVRIFNRVVGVVGVVSVLAVGYGVYRYFGYGNTNNNNNRSDNTRF